MAGKIRTSAPALASRAFLRHDGAPMNFYRAMICLLGLLPGIEANPHSYGDYARRNLSASEAAILRHESRAA